MKKTGFVMAMLSIMICNMLFSSQTACYADDSKRVLYISSYSYSWGSVPFQIKGILQTLGDKYIVNYEFMDTKNTVYSNGYKEFYDLLKYKLHTRKGYDAVIVADDAALNFINLYKNELFPDIPIVFQGIDNIENGVKAAEDKHITGIVEAVDYGSNLKLAQELFPKAKRLVLILDNMENGVGIAKQLQESEAHFASYEVEYLNSSEYTKAELCDKLNKLDEHSIVFCISMGQSKNGKIYTESERYAMIRDYTHVPMFRFTQSGVGNGLLGGYIIDHEACGRLAAELVVKMLNEPQMEKPAVIMNTPSIYYFDYNVFERYGLSVAGLPKEVLNNSVFINRPESFLVKNAISIIVILLLLLCIVSIIFYLKQRKEAELKTELLEKAKAANAAKTDFFSKMSHDLRTPLNGIIGSSLLARDKITAEDSLNENLQDITDSGEYMLGLINDILDMAKIESGRIKLNIAGFQANKLFADVKMLFMPICRERKVELIIKDSLPAVDVMVDRQRVQQVAYNIISNAIKFTEAGGKVEFSAVEEQGTADMMQFTIVVRDNGIGMSEEFQRNMYEAFTQEDNAVENQLHGSGLGLAITKQIIDLMEGTIECQSRRGVGTTFTISLAVPIAAEQSENQLSAEQPKDYRKWFTGRHILLCEDHPLNAKIAKALLEKLGAVIDIAGDGRTGVEMVAASPEGWYAAILMDIRMPVMNGLEAAAAIRKLERADAMSIPIVAMTANAYSDDIKASFTAGMNAHLTKPLDPQMMYQTIFDVCNKK